MMRHVRLGKSSSRTMFFILFFTVIAVISFLAPRTVPAPDIAGVTGWCCLHPGEACVSRADPVACHNEGGVSFTRDPVLCSVACDSPFPTHAAASNNF